MSLTLRVYSLSVLIALGACIYAMLKPGLSVPVYPERKMNSALKSTGTESLISMTKSTLKKDTSDRTVSPLYSYIYSDGSKIMATLVRVKKRDDFKIETYGLLTKNIEPIYLKNSSFVASTPPSLSGMIGKDRFFQTCIIPKSKTPEEIDFRLDRLLTTLKQVNPASDSLLDKIMGTKKYLDYSCLVLTYKPSKASQLMPPNSWQIITRNVQKALSM